MLNTWILGQAPPAFTLTRKCDPVYLPSSRSEPAEALPSASRATSSLRGELSRRAPQRRQPSALRRIHHSRQRFSRRTPHDPTNPMSAGDRSGHVARLEVSSLVLGTVPSGQIEAGSGGADTPA